MKPDVFTLIGMRKRYYSLSIWLKAIYLKSLGFTADQFKFGDEGFYLGYAKDYKNHHIKITFLNKNSYSIGVYKIITQDDFPSCYLKCLWNKKYNSRFFDILHMNLNLIKEMSDNG